jgi:hypothetical protein
MWHPRGEPRRWKMSNSQPSLSSDSVATETVVAYFIQGAF